MRRHGYAEGWLLRTAARAPKRQGGADATARELNLNELLHVLYLIDSYHSKAAGGEGALLKMTRFLPRNRYRCSVVVFASDLNPAELARQFECPVHFLRLTRTYNWNAARVAMQLRSLIRSQEVAIVHTFFTTSDLWGGLVARLSGVPVLISSRRDMGILRTRRHRIAYRLLRKMYDQVQAVSEEVRGFSIRADRLDPSRVVTIHNGVDLDEVRSAPKLNRVRDLPELGWASHVIVSVGNVRRIKGTDDLIRAAATVCHKFPRAAILIIGKIQEQEYFAELQGLIENLGLKENIKFLGARGDVLSLLKMSDLFCLQSLSEGHSNALIEAMACGLPCVVTRVGGNAEVVVEGQSGYLVPINRPDLAGERLLELLENPPRAKAMGACGRQIVEASFTIQTMMRRLVELYDGLVEHRPS